MQLLTSYIRMTTNILKLEVVICHITLLLSFCYVNVRKEHLIFSELMKKTNFLEI